MSGFAAVARLLGFGRGLRWDRRENFLEWGVNLCEIGRLGM